MSSDGMETVFWGVWNNSVTLRAETTAALIPPPEQVLAVVVTCCCSRLVLSITTMDGVTNDAVIVATIADFSLDANIDSDGDVNYYGRH